MSSLEARMYEISDKALDAAARAIFEHSLLAGGDPKTHGRTWITEADAYRDIARAAIEAALPHLKPPS